MPRLITEWSTDDPSLARMLRQISRLHGVQRLAAEAALHTFLAGHCHEQIGHLQANRRRTRKADA